jgi:hypothetical protein
MRSLGCRCRSGYLGDRAAGLGQSALPLTRLGLPGVLNPEVTQATIGIRNGLNADVKEAVLARS